MTTWARAGIYDVDFGLGSRIRYADGIVPNLDGCVLIKDAPPPPGQFLSGSRLSWTRSGVDISVHICTEDMERLLKDPLLLPHLDQIESINHGTDKPTRGDGPVVHLETYEI